MKKKLLTMLAAILLAGTNAFAADYADINGICYELFRDEATVKWPVDNSNLGSSVVIPPSVTSNGQTYRVTCIGDNAFEGCSGLTSVTIGNNVTRIGVQAFYSCSDLTSIIIPNSVTSIGFCAFEYTGWYNSQSDGLVYAGKVAYRYKGTMPSGTQIEIAVGTLGIADYAFSCFRTLAKVILPNSLTNIGSYAFELCPRLTSVTIPNSVTSIGESAFRNCTGMTSITIGSAIREIGEDAFQNCSNLTDVYCYAENVPSAYSIFHLSPISSATLHVPVAFIEAYKTTEPWSGFGTIAPIYDEESSKPFPAGTYAKADLKRTFEEGWNTICLPFAVGDIEAAFGTGAKAYGFDDFADGELKFSQVTSLSAGTPYVIYVPAEITELIAFENIVVEESNTTSSNIDKNGACFRGTYAPVAAGEWTKNNSTDNIYGITPDGKIRKAGPEASILGLRAYFDIPAGTEVKGFVFENGATAITEITENTENSEPIYNLAGQRLNKAQKGINIVNGKKVLY